VSIRIVILGGGPAGYEAALVAASRGPEAAQVTVIDSDGIGGAAVLYDCIPSKTLIASTGVRSELRRAPHLGFDIDVDDAKYLIAGDPPASQDVGRRAVRRHHGPTAQRGC
jgi:NAD(P)H dehydrogenase (quinone)